MENLRRQGNLDQITKAKLIKCFRANVFRKGRNRYKIEKIVVMKNCCQIVIMLNVWNGREIVAYIKEKIANQEKVLCGGISRTCNLFKNIKCHISKL